MARSFFILFISYIACSQLQAQTTDSIQSHNLSAVEISAHNKPSVALSATPLQIFTSQEIEKLGLYSISDVIRRFNGVVLKDYGGIGGLKTISVRGMGAEYTGISYDGIMINNQQSGQVDIGRFAMDNISMVTLNIGQADDIFLSAKSFSSAGVLSLQTLAPEFNEHKYTGHAKITGGSFGLFNPALYYAQKLNKTFTVSINGSWQRADGNYPFTFEQDKELTERKRKNSDVDILRTEINIYSDFGNSGQLNAKVYHFDSERGLPGNVILYNDYSKERLWDKNTFAQIAYSKDLGIKFKLKSQAKYDYTYTKYADYHSQYGQTGKLVNKYWEKEAYLSNAVLFNLDENISFSLAEDLFYGKLKSDLPNSEIDQFSPERYNSYTAFAAKYKNNRLTATFSTLGTFITEKKKNRSDNTYKKISPAATISYQPFSSTGVRVRASYKHAYRVPTFSELYYSSVEKNLKAESAKQYNLGLTWVGSIGSSSIRYINASIDGFYNKVDNKIVIIPKTFSATSLNMDVDIKGLDFKLASNILINQKMDIDISATYSLMKAIDVTGISQDSYKDQIPYTPLHSGSATITLNNPWVNISYSMIASGERYSMPINEKASRIDGYTDHSIALHKEFKLNKNRLYIQGNLLNIYNKNYDVIAYYPMPGRSFNVSAGIHF